jgi:hypothetical protein
MNPLKMLLLVIVSAGLACSAFAIERNTDTPAAAVEANGAPGAAILAATAPVTELGLPAAANYRLASAAAVQYAAADGGRISARAAANTGGVAAPQTARPDATLRGFRFPAMPEPTEWMQLLCGLVVAGFIARRRTSVAPG